MNVTYQQRRHPAATNRQISQPDPRGHVDDGWMNGSAQPTAAQKGRPINLDAAIKVKMENAFGDLSGVKLYESPAVGEAGAEAVARGNEIAFAPGMTDFSSRTGQERLGHELSHVMSQRSGLVRGRGFLADASLEAQADREGAMAAAGEQVYSGPVTTAISGASPAPASAAPMQAKCGGKRGKQAEQAVDLAGQAGQGIDEKKAVEAEVQAEAGEYDPNNIVRDYDNNPLDQGFISKRPKKGKRKKRGW